jgi:hypothetical protein
MNTTTITCKCKTHQGAGATLPTATLEALKAAEGKRFRAHMLVSNAHGRDSVSAIVRQQLTLQAA